MNTCRIAVSLVSSLSGIESAEMFIPANPDSSGEAATVENRANAFVSASGIVFSAVLTVLMVLGFAQIGPAVITPVAINVVNFVFRIAPGYELPDQWSSMVVASIEHDRKAALSIGTSRILASKSRVPNRAYPGICEMSQGTFAPPQTPGVRLVTEAFTQIFNGRQRLAHGEILA